MCLGVTGAIELCLKKIKGLAKVSKKYAELNRCGEGSMCLGVKGATRTLSQEN